MFDLNLFCKPAFSGVSYGTFAIGAGMFAMFLYITIYMQSVIGMTPLQAGVRFLPLTLFAFIVPLMLVMFFGTVEFSSAVAVDRKVTLIARTLSDLTSQSPGR